jgi:two-component system response regulator RegA
LTARALATYRPQVARAARIAEDQSPSVQKVLLVDDHEMYLKYCTRDFVRAGVTVSTTQTLAGARELVRKDSFDLAIVDLFLTPPENGLDVIRAVKQLDPHVFCILVSAHMSVSHALMGVRAGADDVFPKPFGARQAIARVERDVHIDVPDPTTPTLHEVEWEHIARVLHDHDGNISHAAESLGIFRQSLQRKIQKYAPRVLVTDEEHKPYPIVTARLVEAPPPPPAPKSKAKAQAKVTPIAKAKPTSRKKPRRH